MVRALLKAKTSGTAPALGLPQPYAAPPAIHSSCVLGNQSSIARSRCLPEILVTYIANVDDSLSHFLFGKSTSATISSWATNRSPQGTLRIDSLSRGIHHIPASVTACLAWHLTPICGRFLLV